MSLTWPLLPVHDGRMKTIMSIEDLTTIDQVTAFLEGVSGNVIMTPLGN